ncbi:MAG TPA: non-canonical purine NTP pyrophosphatase [Candidatus Binataceae bacterium]|nr:non-canonical purine NTP pyrophosphatase [Candidatus Binataceae bacterium]
MKQILVATTNPAKLAEYRLLLGEFGLDVISLRTRGISESPEETGATFEENALIKVRFYFERAKMPTIADDGGLEIDALGGEPGVKSHRWLGGDRENTDDELVAEVMRRMQGVPAAQRTARLRAAAVVKYEFDGIVRESIAEAAIEGVIAARAWPVIRPGFPYRAVLFLPDRNLFLGQLGEADEAHISQRRESLLRLRPDLERIATTP